MPLADMVVAGSDFMGAQVSQSGGDIRDIFDRLRREFPTESSQSLWAAAARGQAAAEAGDVLDIAADDYRLQPGEVPRPITGNLGWRYSAIASYGPAGGDTVQARYLYLPNPDSMTRGAVFALLDQAAREYLDPGGQVGQSGPVPQGNVLQAINIVGVSRWAS